MQTRSPLSRDLKIPREDKTLSLEMSGTSLSQRAGFMFSSKPDKVGKHNNAKHKSNREVAHERSFEQRFRSSSMHRVPTHARYLPENALEDTKKQADVVIIAQTASTAQESTETSRVFVSKPKDVVDLRSNPDVVIMRNAKQEHHCPDTLSLDCCDLEVMPILHGEQKLRAYNLKSNRIEKIQNLLNLCKLHTLDMCNNQIKKLENLSTLPQLRVLILGKNRVKAIENLERLKMLRVLDLHKNQLTKMENLNALTQLRVLNLSGNKIATLENIDKLTQLSELSVRKNLIRKVKCVGKLPSLRKLWISDNHLQSVEDMKPLLEVHSILELRADNNPICDAVQDLGCIFSKCFPALKVLNVGDVVSVPKDTIIEPDLSSTRRLMTIRAIRSHWEWEIAREDAAENKGNRQPAFASLRAYKLDDFATARTLHEEDYRNDFFLDAEEIKIEDSRCWNQSSGHSHLETYSVAGIHHSVLCINGDALEALDSPQTQSNITAIVFQYLSIRRIEHKFVSGYTTQGNAYAKLQRLIFSHNRLHSFRQLSWIEKCGMQVNDLVIISNAILSRNLLRCFIATTLPIITEFNGEIISSKEKSCGRQLFGMEHNTSRKTPTRQTSNIRVSSDAKSSSRDYSGGSARSEMTGTLDNAWDRIQRRKIFRNCWEQVLQRIIKDTVQELTTHDS